MFADDIVYLLYYHTAASKNNLQVREEKSKGIWVEGASEVYVSSEQDVLDVIRIGSNNRAIAATRKFFVL